MLCVRQGVGGPCCARILTTWFASKERGTYWGMWNIAHNLGGFAAPLVAGGFAKAYGWQWGMWGPGAIAFVVGLFVLITCKDKPEDIGSPPVEPEAPPKKSTTGEQGEWWCRQEVTARLQGCSPRCCWAAACLSSTTAAVLCYETTAQPFSDVQCWRPAGSR